jgi:hypothetical protein
MLGSKKEVKEGKKKQNYEGILGGQPEGKKHLEDFKVNGGFILKLILKTYGTGMCVLVSLVITYIRVNKTTSTCTVLLPHVSTLTGHLQDKIHLCIRHKKDT